MSYLEDIRNFANGAAQSSSNVANIIRGAAQAAGLGGPGPDQQPDPFGLTRGPRPATTNRSVNINGHDPIQGYDVGVWVEDKGRGHKHVLMGQFTGITIQVRNAPEAYRPVGSRQPIYLDGEIQIAFSLDKGLVDTRVFNETFGFKTLNYLNRYIRTPRFKITFAIDPVDWSVLDEDAMQFEERHRRYSAGRMVLEYAVISDWGLTAQAGASPVVTRWMGLAQQIWAEPLTLDNMPQDKRDLYDPIDGNPKHVERIRTFYYSGLADAASLEPPIVNKSQADHPAWLSQYMILEVEKNFLREIKNRIPFDLGNNGNVERVFNALNDAINRLQGRLTSNTSKSSSIAADGSSVSDSGVHVMANAPPLQILPQSYSVDSQAFINQMENSQLNSWLAERAEILRKMQVSTSPSERATLQNQFDFLSAYIEAMTGERKSTSTPDGTLQRIDDEITDARRAIDDIQRAHRFDPRYDATLKMEKDRLAAALLKKSFINGGGLAFDIDSFSDDSTHIGEMRKAKKKFDGARSRSDTDSGEFIEGKREELRKETNPAKRKDIQSILDGLVNKGEPKSESDSKPDLMRASVSTPASPASKPPGQALMPVSTSATNDPESSPGAALMELSTTFQARIQAELTQAVSDLKAAGGSNPQLSQLVGKLKEDLNIIRSFVGSSPPQGADDPDSKSV